MKINYTVKDEYPDSDREVLIGFYNIRNKRVARFKNNKWIVQHGQGFDELDCIDIKWIDIPEF